MPPAIEFSDLFSAASAVERSSDEALDKIRAVLDANRSRVIDIFRDFDESGDGRISKDELRKALALCGHDATATELGALFIALDLDSNGKISLKELHAGLRMKPAPAAAPAAGGLSARRGKNLEVGTKDEEDDADNAAVAQPKAKAALKNKWRGRLGAALVAQRVLMTPLRKMRMRFSTRNSAASFSGPAPVTEVEDQSDLAKLAIWQQGDASLYTAEALQARADTRHHKDVLEVLHIWWQAAQRSLQSGGDESASVLGKAQYVDMMRKSNR